MRASHLEVPMKTIWTWTRSAAEARLKPYGGDSQRREATWKGAWRRPLSSIPATTNSGPSRATTFTRR